MNNPIKCKFYKKQYANGITINLYMFVKDIVECDGVTNLHECPLWVSYK